jgi:Uma2 family endonuclease
MEETVPQVKFTYEHYCLLPEGDRRELIEGEFYVTPAPSEKHQRVCGNIYFHFRLFLRAHSVGSVYIAPFDVILSEFSTVQPDICFIQQKRLNKLKSEGLRGAPDMAIEVFSPSTRDRDEKLKKELYFKHGVRELWLVDPEDDSVYLFKREHNALELWRHFPAGSVLESALLPDLHMRLDDIFE